MVIKLQSQPGTVALAYTPKTLGGRGEWITRSRDRDHPGQHGEIPSLLKIQKISWARGRVPVIPAIQEAEAGELPEPRRRRLWWAEILPLHSSLGNNGETTFKKKIGLKTLMNLQVGWEYIWLGLGRFRLAGLHVPVCVWSIQSSLLADRGLASFSSPLIYVVSYFPPG